jgi:alkanesulfonate monooxygenase SsuD/methylene tetrahydromethanopterin reductase-like flavin-dependent oxidoreductase (luciferase family)
LLAPTDSRATQEELRARFKSIPDTGLISGTPEACVERIREYQDAGIDHFLFTIPDVADSAYLDVVGEQILPHLKPARHTQPT